MAMPVSHPDPTLQQLYQYDSISSPVCADGALQVASAVLPRSGHSSDDGPAPHAQSGIHATCGGRRPRGLTAGLTTQGVLTSSFIHRGWM